MRVIVDADGRCLDDAARVWAAAAAVRDGRDDAAPVAVARPLIAGVLAASPRSVLVVALDPDEAGRVVGFGACEPRHGAANADVATLRYLGVDPAAWGRGVAGALLDGVSEALAARGFARADLRVYVDNDRAVALFRRRGWRPYGAAHRHERTGRWMQPYELALRQG